MFLSLVEKSAVDIEYIEMSCQSSILQWVLGPEHILQMLNGEKKGELWVYCCSRPPDKSRHNLMHLCLLQKGKCVRAKVFLFTGYPLV